MRTLLDAHMEVARKELGSTPEYQVFDEITNATPNLYRLLEAGFRKKAVAKKRGKPFPIATKLLRKFYKVKKKEKE